MHSDWSIDSNSFLTFLRTKGVSCRRRCRCFVFLLMYRYYINCHQWKPRHDQWIYALRCLPSVECQRLDQYQFQRDVKFSLIGQLLIRYLLSEVFEKKSSTFDIERTSNNRPWIKSNPPFDFNLSHQHHLVAIAGTFHHRIGCDTIVYSSTRNYQRLARKILTKDEYNYLVNHADPLRCFYRFWSLKESYVKWLGQGVGFPFVQLNFRLSTSDFIENKLIFNTKLELNSNVRFDEELIILPNDDQQLITLCLSHENPVKSFEEISIDDLLNRSTPLDDEDERKDLQRSWEDFQRKSIV